MRNLRMLFSILALSLIILWGGVEQSWAQTDKWPQSMADFKWPWSGIYNACGGESWQIVPTGGYGAGYHTGNDYHAVDLERLDGATKGSKILAPARGKVTIAGWSKSCGWWIMMDHGSGWTSKACHMNCDPNNFTKVGDDLLQGTQIGIAGDTGWTGPERGLPPFAHIHFVIYKNGVSQPFTGISGCWTIATGSPYSSGNAFINPPKNRTTCP